jgi:hypothetical protein
MLNYLICAQCKKGRMIDANTNIYCNFLWTNGDFSILSAIFRLKALQADRYMWVVGG